MRGAIAVLALGLLAACAPALTPNSPAATRAPALVLPPTYTPTFTPTALPTVTPGPTLPPLVLPQVRLELLSSNAYRGPSVVYVAGAAINRGTLAAGEVRVAVSLIDARGNVAATGSLNLAHIWYVAPNGKFPFLIPIPTAPKDWKDVKVQFETKPYSVDQLHQPYWNFQIDKVAGQLPKASGAYPNFGYSGSVKNIGGKRARMVQVTAIAFDSGGKVIDVAASYIAFEYLNPGQDAPFQMYFNLLKTAPARYEMLAEGYLTE